jgi:chromosomal replication initiation ATPase DnaA
MKVNWKLYDDQEADKFAFLVRIVAEVFSVTPEQILCRSRFARWVEPRQLVATIWSENHSLQETGYRLDRHHGAIIHARERVRPTRCASASNAWSMKPLWKKKPQKKK